MAIFSIKKMGGNANAVPGGKDKKGSQGAHSTAMYCCLISVGSTQ